MSDQGLPSTQYTEQVCPVCSSRNVVALGRIVATQTGVEMAFRCRECGNQFWWLRSA